MPITNRSLLGVLLSGCLLAATLHADGIRLRFHPEPGSVFHLRQEIEQDIQVNLGPLGTQEFKNKIVIESTQKIFEGEQLNSSRIEQVINRLRITASQGESTLVEFDSADQKKIPEISEAIAPLLGKPLTIHFSEQGEILKISGYSEMLSSLGGIDDPKILETLKQGLSEESVAQMMQMSLPTFPDRALTVGDTWTHDSEFNNPLFGTMSIKSEYTVNGTEMCAQEECVRLDVAMDQSLELDSGIFDQLKALSGAALDLNIDTMQGNGTIWIAIADGMTLKSEIRQQIMMTMKVSGEGQAAIEMNMAADQRIDQILERSLEL